MSCDIPCQLGILVDVLDVKVTCYINSVYLA